MNRGFQRTVNVPKHYTMQPDGSSALYNSTYIGFVKDNSDALAMGRLRVWIPDLTSDAENGLITVNYCSPFAGATPIANVNKESKTDSQVSYGFWAVPPDIDNEVIVQFINGDPNKGIWIGCLFQQFMNNMVPGIPNGPTTTSNGKQSAPVQEYSKWDQTEGIKDSPLRPPFGPLAAGLQKQGLANDPVRGSSTSSARRDNKSNVLGILTPGGSQFVMDDDPTNSFIRFRTKSGTQILINDTVGMVYMISKNGNSWAEIGDDGINVYSSGPISMRSRGDINFHADKTVNIFGGKGVNIATPAGITLQGSGAINLVSGDAFNIQSQGQLSLISGEDTQLQSGCTIGLQASCNVAIQSTMCIGLTATCGLYLKGAPLYQNGPIGPTPGGATPASTVPIVKQADTNAVTGAVGSSQASSSPTNSIVSSMPAHGESPGQATEETPTGIPSDRVKDSCIKHFSAFKGDCSGFVRAVSNDVGVNINGLANDMVNTIRSHGAWHLLADGNAAAASAQAGKLVIGGLRGNEEASPNQHGHVVVIVPGPLAQGKYPTAYWGSLGGPSGQNQTINYSWTVQDRDRITYAWAELAPVVDPPTTA